MALSMFSVIPVPNINFNKANMKYALCFFPAVGVIIGIVQYSVYNFMVFKGLNNVFIAAVITVLPIFLTGGIHMDGFIDTSDAIKSYADRQKKLEILSDPHIGAFGVICLAIYIVIYFGAVCQADKYGIYMFCSCFVVSRILSGIAAVTFNCAKKEGLIFTFANSADKFFVRNFLVGLFILCCGWFAVMYKKAGVLCILSALIVFVYYRYFLYNKFGGITGDLAGYFLQLCEIAMLLCAVLTV